MAGYVKPIVRQLRKDQTESETILWEKLRNRNWKGYKFYRQHPIFFDYNGQRRFFVADFYSAKLKLIIEIDGKIHESQQEYDEYRTFIINHKRIHVIRFTNEDVINIEAFLQSLEVKFSI